MKPEKHGMVQFGCAVCTSLVAVGDKAILGKDEQEL